MTELLKNKKQPNLPLHKDHAPAAIAEVLHLLTGKSPGTCKPAVLFALSTTLNPLFYHATDSVFDAELTRMAYFLADQCGSIRLGRAPAFPGLPVDPVWALAEVVSIGPVLTADGVKRISDINYQVQSRIISGQFAGQTVSRNFSKQSLVFLSPKMGFGKRPRNENTDKKPKHPRLMKVEDIKELMWCCLLQASNSSMLTYFDLGCSAAIMNYNREIIHRRLANVSGLKTNGIKPLVQPKPRSRFSDYANSTGSYLEHGGRIAPVEPRLCQDSSTAQSHNERHDTSS